LKLLYIQLYSPITVDRKNEKSENKQTIQVITSIPSYNYTTPHHNRFMALFRDNPGQPVPEENFWTL